MKPIQKLKQLILAKAAASQCITAEQACVTEATVDDVYERLSDAGLLQDDENEVRVGTEGTGLPDRTPFSRGNSYYESRTVASQMLDGTWVGWTYWYGGGKHAEPSAIPWMEYAYEVQMTEEKVMITRRTFTATAGA